MKANSSVLVSLPLLLGILFLANPAPAAVISWTNTTGGLWSAATNWSTGTVPAASDDVVIAVAGNYTVTQDLHVTVASLTLGGTAGTQTLTNAAANLTLNGPSAVSANGWFGFGGGTLAGAGALTVGGKVVWTGGTISGALTIAPNGSLSMSGTGTKYLNGTGTLINQGLVVWSGTNDIQTANSAQVINEPGAVFDIQNNQALTMYNGGVITNRGTLRKSAGGGITVISVPLHNSGTLDVQSGLVAYSAGSQFYDGTAFTGSGTNLVYTGPVTFNGAIASANLELGGATIAANGSFSGIVNWSSGTLSSGTMTIAPNGVLNMRGSAILQLNGTGTLINQGLVVWSGTNDIQTANSARIINEPGAVFDIQNNQAILIGNGGYITNRGTLRKSAGGGITMLTVPFCNAGTLDVQSGSLAYGGSCQFEDGTAFTGAGTNLVYAGTATFEGAIASANLELAGATIAGNGSISGVVDWTSGPLSSGVLTIASNGVLHVSGTATKHVGLSGMLVNHGLIVWSGANDIETANSARIINQPGALFDIQNNQLLAIYNGGYFTNLGTLRKSAGGGSTIITVPLVNSGRLEVQSGLVGFGANNQFHDGTTFAGAGTNLLYAGTATFNGAIASANLELGGAQLAGNGSFSGVVNWTSGTLGSGVLTMASNGMLRIIGSATKDLTGTGTLVNFGSVVWSGSNDIQTANSARIINEAGAVFEIQNNQLLAIYNGGYLTNRGTLRKSAGGGNTIITVPVINSGNLDVQSGLVAYGPNSQFHAGTAFTGPGTNLVYGGTVTFDGGMSAENLELGGANIGGNSIFSGVLHWTSGTLPDNGALTVATNGVLNLRGIARIDLGGALTNCGRILWSGTNDLETFREARIINQPGALFDIQNDQMILIWNGGAFTNLGTVRKTAGGGNTHFNLPFRNLGTVDAQSGTIIFASYTQTDGKLSIGLNNLTNFGRLAFAGGIAFTGTLAANLNGGFAPVAGNTFEVIHYTTRTGTFADFDLPPSHAWQTNSSIYGANAVTLTVLNSRPAFATVADRTTDEQTLLNFPITGNDPDPGQSLSYALVDPPNGAAIHTTSGLLTWTPTEAQGPSTNILTIQIADNGTPSLTATQQFIVVVNEVNLAPTLSVPIAPTLDELTLLSVTNSAIDPDLPANTFHYRLVSAPDGVSLDPDTGVLTWTPTEVQGPNTNTIIVAVTDSGTPPLSATNSFAVIVREVNTPPVLSVLSDCTHVAGALCWITNSVADADVPGQQMTFSLVNAPLGMSIGPTSGVMIWAPPVDGVALTNTVKVCVADNGFPRMTNEQSFTATLVPLPRLRIRPAGPNLVVLSWPAAATEAGFVLQSTTDLLPSTNWQSVAGAPVLSAGEYFLTNSAAAGFRAYRLVSALMPLPTLQIATTHSNVAVVAWPASAMAVGFALQTTPNLEPPIRWSSATNEIRTNGSLNFVTDPLASPQRYYRLQLPALP